jgi:hypothetical protein
MAGAGYKSFTPSSLTSDEVNTYLMQQSVMVFASSAARSSALPVPTEGMVSYLQDTDSTELYTGSAWVAFVTQLNDNSGFRNLLINGAMQISQRSAIGTAVTGITNQNYYGADRFRASVNSFGTWSQTTIADAPTGSGFRNSLKMICTTAPSSLAGNVYATINQLVEAQNCQAICKGTSSAQTLTFSFWVKAGIAGTYIVDLFDSNSRQVSKAYTISAINVWEYKTIVIPADTSASGVIENTNATGLGVRWWLGVGTSYTSGTLNTSWNTVTLANMAVGQTNVASGNNASVNYWQMTGAQLTIGSVAPPFEQRPIGVELALCQRYYAYMDYLVDGTGANFVDGYQINTAYITSWFKFPQTMRIRPTSVVLNIGGYSNTQGWTATAVGPDYIQVYANPITTGRGYYYVSNLAGSAEL